MDNVRTMEDRVGTVSFDMKAFITRFCKQEYDESDFKTEVEGTLKKVFKELNGITRLKERGDFYRKLSLDVASCAYSEDVFIKLMGELGKLTSKKGT